MQKICKIKIPSTYVGYNQSQTSKILVMGYKKLLTCEQLTCLKKFGCILCYFNLLRTSGWFTDQRHKRQERIISITIAN